MQYITLHYITLHYITLHYITLHYITLHYITLHYITLHYIHYIHYMHACIHTYYNLLLETGEYGKDNRDIYSLLNELRSYL